MNVNATKEKHEEIIRVDRCKCGKLQEDHYLPVDLLKRHSLTFLMQQPVFWCNEYPHKGLGRYEPMSPMELAVWIEEEYERLI